MKKRVKMLKDFGEHKAGSIVELDSAVAMQLVETKFAVEVADDNVADSVQKMLKEWEEGLRKAVVAAVDQRLEAATKSQVEIMGRITGVKSAAENDEDVGNLGEFAKRVLKCNHQVQSDPVLKVYVERKVAMGGNEVVGEDGGILVPDTLAAKIWERVTDGDLNIINMVDSYDVAGASMTMNGLVDDDKSASGSRNGGVIGYWVDEAEKITASKLKWRKLQLNLHKLAVLCFVTDELMSDSSVSLDQWLTRKAGDEIRFLTNEAFIAGDGIGKPLGILNSPALVTIAKEGSQANASVVWQNISKMWAALHPMFREKAIWMINAELEPLLDGLCITGAASGVFPIYMPPGGISEKPYGRIKGRPVMVTDHMPELGTGGDMALVDWSNYVAIKKGTVKSAVSIHLRFDYDEACFKFTYRVDGRMGWDKALKPAKGSSTFRQSSAVILGARTGG